MFVFLVLVWKYNIDSSIKENGLEMRAWHEIKLANQLAGSDSSEMRS